MAYRLTKMTRSHHPSTRDLSSDLSLGLTLFLSGMLIEVVGDLVFVRLYRRWIINRACWGDFIIWSLLHAAVALDSVARGAGTPVSAVRPARAALHKAARQIEADPISRAAVGVRDLHGKREARSDRLRIAALKRIHAGELLHVRDARDLYRVRIALVAALHDASAGQWEEILQRAPAVPPRRMRWWLNRSLMAVALCAVALAAPHLPGLAETADYRLPLLLTSLLTLLSGAGSAKEVLKEAAGAGLWESAAKHV